MKKNNAAKRLNKKCPVLLDHNTLGTKGLGIEVDVEDSLDLDSSVSVFRVDGLWRFSRNLRHRLDLGWFDISRDSTTTLLGNIQIGDTLFPLGTEVTTSFDLQVFKGAYSYSFFQDDRIDLGASFGLFVMPIDFKIDAYGAFEGHESESITAPLPVLGLRADFAITPKLFLKYNVDFFYLEMGQFEGAITDSNLVLEYNAFKYLGFGIGLERFNIYIKAEDEDYPNIDFNGSFEFNYSGLMVYCKVYF
ncbi:MAG: hypothetical protein SWH54_14955 [Thermodesulfobacteriota bacterium]|nr:hypothetical protein [Thermodesulfobacteriota bacterium]